MTFLQASRDVKFVFSPFRRRRRPRVFESEPPSLMLTCCCSVPAPLVGGELWSCCGKTAHSWNFEEDEGEARGWDLLKRTSSLHCIYSQPLSSVVGKIALFVCLSCACLKKKKGKMGKKTAKEVKKKGYKQEIFIRIYDKLKLHYFGNFLSYFALI